MVQMIIDFPDEMNEIIEEEKLNLRLNSKQEVVKRLIENMFPERIAAKLMKKASKLNK